ncbi:hypothetical protein WJX79_005691 [Trebouxia sp. C0005]
MRSVLAGAVDKKHKIWEAVLKFSST